MSFTILVTRLFYKYIYNIMSFLRVFSNSVENVDFFNSRYLSRDKNHAKCLTNYIIQPYYIILLFYYHL